MNKVTATVLGVALAITIGVIVLQPVVAAVDGSTGSVSEEENVTIQYDEYQDLAGYQIDAGNTTVENDAGTVLTEGTDYELATGNGSIKFLDTTDTTEGNVANVTYTYQASGTTTSLVLGFVPVMFGVLLFVGVSNGVQDMMP